MTQQTINVGASANDKQGDSLRAAFTKVNANFTGAALDRLATAVKALNATGA